MSRLERDCIANIPSPRLLSDLAFRLFAASALCAARSFCLSRCSFSRWLRAAVPLIFLTPLLPFAPSFEESSSEIFWEGERVAFDGDRESDDVLRLLDVVLTLNPVVSNGVCQWIEG
jgi:hypothetical protein